MTKIGPDNVIKKIRCFFITGCITMSKYFTKNVIYTHGNKISFISKNV